MSKKDTFMDGPAVPSYPRSPLVEAAKLLASQARLFAQDRALASDVDRAVEEWKAAMAAVADEKHDPYLCHEEPCAKCADVFSASEPEKGTR